MVSKIKSILFFVGTCLFSVNTWAQNDIVGGEPAIKGEYPWLLNMKLDGRHICGATLLTPEWVLTAAHCVIGVDENDPGLKLIANDYRDLLGEIGEERLSVDKIFIHPAFRNVEAGFDIALLHLRVPSVQSAFATLPPDGDTLLSAHGNSCSLLGWGIRDTFRQVFADTLQLGNSQIMTHAVCNDANHYNSFLINTNVLCASPDRSPVVTGSLGDSGGPMLVDNGGKWVQVGITSHGFPGSGWGTPKHPAVYTMVSKYISWINTVTGLNTGLSDKQSNAEKFRMVNEDGGVFLYYRNPDMQRVIRLVLIDQMGRTFSEEELVIPCCQSGKIALRNLKTQGIWSMIIKEGDKITTLKYSIF